MDGNSGTSNSKLGKTSGSSIRKGRNSGGAAETEEDSESESESSSSSSAFVLDDFRLKWEAELKAGDSSLSTSQRSKLQDGGKPNATDDKVSDESKSTSTAAPASLNSCTTLPGGVGGAVVASVANIEEQAKRFFLMGVGLERQGDLYDAVRFYRRAMQLVPDIEYRVNNSNHDNSTPSSHLGSPDDSEDENNADEDKEDCRDENDEPLVKKFLRIIEANGWQFFEKAKADIKTHLGDIPVEVLSYILRWVISSDLDVRSLDVLSGTSRGFYSICRDDQLWKMACDRVWSDCCVTGSDFSTYRQMFLKRMRVRFDGCYISKVTYVRPGEHSFQDQSYRPWHLVEYYRYIRFFPNGDMYFLTTADQPASTVGGLRDQQPRNPATLRGKYRLYGNNLVTAVVKKPSAQPALRVRNSREVQETTNFHLEFEISALKKRSSWILKWHNYSVYASKSSPTNNQRNNNNGNHNPEIVHNNSSLTNFELNPNRYPALYFSRVKSYTTKAENVLE